MNRTPYKDICVDLGE